MPTKACIIWGKYNQRYIQITSWETITLQESIDTLQHMKISIPTTCIIAKHLEHNNNITNHKLSNQFSAKSYKKIMKTLESTQINGATDQPPTGLSNPGAARCQFLPMHPLMLPPQAEILFFRLTAIIASQQPNNIMNPAPNNLTSPK